MQITSSTLTLSAAHSAEDSVQMQERVQIRKAAPPASSVGNVATPQDSTDYADANSYLAQWLYEYFTGHKAPLLGTMHFSAPAASAARTAPSVSYSRQEVHHEAESSAFQAEGTATLQSGAKVDFSLQLTMNREMTQAKSLTFQTGKQADPIAVNLDGLGVQLSSDRSGLDVNGDGVDELVATLAQGSAWLAQDVNGDGKITSGRELFGPGTGNGFQELAALDADHNGWIDQNDPAYQRLGITRDGQFTSLKDAGIGALADSSVDTPFTLKQGSETLGQVRQSGVYLREDGTAGALQQVDLEL